MLSPGSSRSFLAKRSQCRTYDECMRDIEDDSGEGLAYDYDIMYVAAALEREYYVF
jgi:hypothetical protein